jgi:hypothetical protein
MDAERAKRKALTKARTALRACQQDRDAFLRRYPDYTEAKRLFEVEVTRLHDNLDRLGRGS